MLDTVDPIPPQNIFRVDPSHRQLIPLYGASVQAGFASPAENFIEAQLNLQDLCVGDPDTTYFVKAAGESMSGDYIFPGSILVVDSALPITTGRVIVCSVNGEWCVKRYIDKSPLVMLEPSNTSFLPIYVHPDQDQFELLGVVTWIVSKPPKYVRPC